MYRLFKKNKIDEFDEEITAKSVWTEYSKARDYLKEVANELFEIINKYFFHILFLVILNYYQLFQYQLDYSKNI